MANWNLPVLSTPLVDQQSILKERDLDSAQMFNVGSPSNIPENAIRFNVSSGVFQRREGGSWVTRPITSSGMDSVLSNPGSFGSNISIPTFTVDSRGRLTAAGSNTVRSASTSQTGVVQLNNSTGSTSTAQAATANAVKLANDNANTRALASRNINAGNGLTGGGNLTSDRTITMGTPGTLTLGTSNEATSTSHTHEIGEDVYSEETVSLDSGDFFGGDLKCARIGSIVTLTATSNISHTTDSFLSSSTGLIPSQYRPPSSVTHMFRLFGTSSGGFGTVEVTVSGGIAIQYNNFSGGSLTRSDTGGTFSITYNLW